MSFNCFIDPDGNGYGSFETFQMYGCPDFEDGWYWQCCFPGCLPDSEAYGPFKTEDDAIKDANDT